MAALFRRTALISTAFAVLAAGLAGCGTDGVELNGKIFDAMGVSPSAQAASRREPKLTDRAPLVMPPNTARLPEPGADAEGAVDVSTQLNDPERKKQMAAAERDKLHKAYCSGEATWKERATSRPGYGQEDAPRSPYGSCGALGEYLKQ
jgi:hypothetical protein